MSSGVLVTLKGKSELNHSDKFNFHIYAGDRQSDGSSAILDFCSSIWTQYLLEHFPSPKGLGKRAKRTLPDQFVTLLLNFYRSWFYDDTKVLAVPLHKPRYKVHKTINPNNLSERLPAVVHKMVEVGLVHTSLNKR